MYIASCSFGKDSIATILLALEHNEPLDRVVFSEVMFDQSRNISAEIPEHIEWVYNVAIPKLEQMGVKVDVVRAEKDYVTLVRSIRKKGNHIGKALGFPYGGHCWVNSELKVAPIKKYYTRIAQGYDITQYVGIAIDEPIRLQRLDGTNKVSLLAKYGYTEDMAMQKCVEFDIVSPSYSVCNRGGCWCCMNRTIKAYTKFRRKHPHLWNELRELDKIPNRIIDKFKYGLTLSELETKMDKFELKEKQQLRLFEDEQANSI